MSYWRKQLQKQFHETFSKVMRKSAGFQKSFFQALLKNFHDVAVLATWLRLN